MSIRNSLEIGGAVLLIGLAVAVYHRGNVIDALEQENAVYQKANQELTAHLAQERQAVEQQKAITDKIQKATDEKISKISTALKTQPCAITRLPDVVIDGLRTKGHHEN